MIKKLFTISVLAVILVGFFGIYKYQKRQERLHRQAEIDNAKAEEITITIVEGWNNKEIGQYLEKQKIVTAAEFSAALKNFDASKYENFLPKKAGGDLQGFLYPDTYRLFAWVADRDQTTAKEASEQILSKLIENFEKRLPKNAAALASRQGLDLYQAVTLASIVEKETGRNASTGDQKAGLNAERKIIAGIFYNRLKINMGLKSDATVNYVTGKNLPAVTEQDTKIDSPYNTYKYRGLPPTPISNPSLSSILAVLNPADTDYMYFLHEQKTGKAYYAVTYEQHLINKQKYLK